MQIDLDNIFSLITACVVAVLTASLTSCFTRRAERTRELRQRKQAAAGEPASSLRDLRALLRMRGHLPVSPQQVSKAVGMWTEVWDRQMHLVPAPYSAVGSSVRSAVGEVFGAVAMVDLRPDLADYPLADADFMWQDFGTCYINYVVGALVRWGDETADKPTRVSSFDRWLVTTGRRKPVGQNSRTAVCSRW